MAEVTVRQFAEVVGISIDRLLDQLKEAGVEIDDADATISETEKMELLGFLRRKHGAADKTEPKKITLNRKKTSELRQTGSHGKAKSVTVEVRKKRTYVKRSVVMEEENKRIEEEQAKQRAIEEEAERIRLEQEQLAAKKLAEAQALKEAEEAKKTEVQAKISAEEEAKKQAEEIARKQAEVAKDDRGGKGKKGKKADKLDDRETRYGRKELHVTADKSGRRKKPTLGYGRFEMRKAHGWSSPLARWFRSHLVKPFSRVVGRPLALTTDGIDCFSSQPSVDKMNTHPNVGSGFHHAPSIFKIG